MTTNPEAQVTQRLWCLHAIGPDEVHPAPDFATAQAWADAANAAHHEAADVLRFVVATWPWSARSHADGLPEAVRVWSEYVRAHTRPTSDVEALREALEPFANEADRLGGMYPNQGHAVALSLVPGCALTIADIRRARAALSASHVAEQGEDDHAG